MAVSPGTVALVACGLLHSLGMLHSQRHQLIGAIVWSQLWKLNRNAITHIFASVGLLLINSTLKQSRGGGPPPHPWASRVASPPHVTPSHHRGLEHPTPSHHLLKINVSPAPGFATDEETFSQTKEFVDDENIFTKTCFRIHELCDKKQEIKLTSLLSHNVPRTVDL